ncbi:OsmC family protein [Salinigranum marinum]|uniref:OsmC family protein n=1 Tax=Salinigranum marinum TaxID=1515595 RepID=UPI002989B0AF|nr:OsmC family protein [Salinigranum marinum]
MSESALSTYELTGRRISPQRMEVDTGETTFEIGASVNPIEYFLGSVVGCLNSTGTVVARDMGIEIDELELTVEGAVNYAKYKGEPTDDRAGLQRVEVTVSVDADADESELRTWLAAVEDRCPVTDNVENGTAVDVGLDVH